MRGKVKKKKKKNEKKAFVQSWNMLLSKLKANTPALCSSSRNPRVLVVQWTMKMTLPPATRVAAAAVVAAVDALAADDIPADAVVVSSRDEKREYRELEYE